VLQFTFEDLKRNKGKTIVEKESAALEQAYNKALRKKVGDVKLLPFDSSVPGTWKWTATLPNDVEPGFHSPKRYFIDLSPEGIVVLNIQGTTDDDDLARRTIATLKHSKERPCQLPRLMGEVPASVGIRPDGSTDAPAAMVTYKSAFYGWSVSYPKGWKVDDSIPEFVQIHPPDKQGLCGIHTKGVEDLFKTAELFADFILAARRKQFGDVQSLMLKPVKLPGGLSAIESLADIQATGRSHQIFVVAHGAGFGVDCEAEIPNWGKLGPLFERVIRSFDVPNLTELTEADSAPPRTFAHPRHPWSIAYPGGWKLEQHDADVVSISRPDSFAYAGCGIYSKPNAQSTSLEDFADSVLRRSAEDSEKVGVHVSATSRRNVSLSGGVTGLEVIREMRVKDKTSGDARSRAVFVVADGMGYILDCRTDARMWDTLAPLFEQIISSFTLQKKP
jgi:hypothetical protein